MLVTSTWAASDKLCAALQIINHLQDCGKDYRDLDRVYIPADALAAHGATVDMLGEDRAPAPLRATIVDLARRTQILLAESAVPLSVQSASGSTVRRRRRRQKWGSLGDRGSLGGFGGQG